MLSLTGANLRSLDFLLVYFKPGYYIARFFIVFYKTTQIARWWINVARARNPKRDLAKKIWLESNKQKPLKEIAEELGVTDSTIRKWKSEDKWEEKTKRSAPFQKERSDSNENEEKPKYESLKGNKNAEGNSGGAPPGNKNAVSHGLFANWLPPETKEIFTQIYDSEPADVIWMNIMIQYTAIIRSQKIMYVENGYDHTSDATSVAFDPKFIDFETGERIKISESRQWQYAWDKQANFLMAQSRAMATLSNLIKQFVSIVDDSDLRRKKLEVMERQVQKADAEIKRLKMQTGDLSQEELPDDGFLEALSNLANDREVWEDDGIES